MTAKTKTAKRTVRVNLARGGYCYMTPSAAKKYKEERKKAQERARGRGAPRRNDRSWEKFERFKKRQDRCFKKGGYYIPTKDKMGRTRFKCDESKNKAKKAKARLEKLDTQYDKNLDKCIKIRTKIMNKGDYVHRVDNTIKRLESKKKAAMDYISKRKDDEVKCIRRGRSILKKASKIAASLKSKNKNKVPRKTAEAKKDPCAELKSIKFNRNRDCKGKGYRKMMLRVHPDKNRECSDIAHQRTSELNELCGR